MIKIYENFIDSKDGYYVNRNGTIIIDKHKNTNIVLSLYTDHSTKYHIFNIFNIDTKKYCFINVDLEEMEYFLPEKYFQKYPDKMLDFTYKILTDVFLDERDRYRNRMLKILVIKWFDKIPELKQNYNIKKSTEKYNL